VEFYDLDWRPLPDAPVEPGHLHEWAWLLGRAKAVLGENLLEEAEALHRTALTIGTDAETGLVFDALAAPNLEPVQTSRSWTQTEALKAHLAMLEHGRIDAREGVARSMDILMDRYLAAPLEGGWIDQFDLAWRPLSEDVPASILYHVILAFTELFRLEPLLTAEAP
ncbi:MAG: AGE family epimerase/isomerase, partial [Caulobacteraceae bacterium]